MHERQHVVNLAMAKRHATGDEPLSAISKVQEHNLLSVRTMVTRSFAHCDAIFSYWHTTEPQRKLAVKASVRQRNQMVTAMDLTAIGTSVKLASNHSNVG